MEEENMMNDEKYSLKDFCVGQKVKYYTTNEPFKTVAQFSGTVKEIHKDYMIVDVDGLSDHCRFEPDFNLHQLVPIPVNENRVLAEKIWDRFYAPYEYTEEDHDRIVDQLYFELDSCGEAAFMMRTVLSDITNHSKQPVLSVYRGDMTETAWNELAEALDTDSNTLKDNVMLNVSLAGSCSTKKEPIIKIIENAIMNVIENSIYDFDKWYTDDFETEVYFENIGELNDTDLEIVKNDWIAWCLDGYVSEVCNTLGIEMYNVTSKYNEMLIEEIHDLVKEKLYNRICLTEREYYHKLSIQK